MPAFFDLVIEDSAGFTFGFTCVAESSIEAKELFLDKIIRSSPRKKINIKSVEYIRDVEKDDIFQSWFTDCIHK